MACYGVMGSFNWGGSRNAVISYISYIFDREAMLNLSDLNVHVWMLGTN